MIDEISLTVLVHCQDQVNHLKITVSTTETLYDVVSRACAILGIDHEDHFIVKKFNILNINAVINTLDIGDGDVINVFTNLNTSYYRNLSKKNDITLKIWRTMIIVALSISLIGLLIIIIIFAVTLTPLFRYGIVLDAGSTSTKVNLFKWDSKYDSNAKVNLLNYCKANPGISDFENDPENSFNSIKKCLDSEIIPFIPVDSLSNTYTFLGATAGMRMLQFKNQTASDAIIENILKSLKNYSLMINQTSDISIMSGKDEGLNGWIAVNYLEGNFNEDNINNDGALDMGGASMQITYRTKHNKIVNDTYIQTLSLFGRNFKLYSHSYLCYGKTQVEMRHLAILIQNVQFDTNIISSCVLKDDVLIFRSDQIFNVPCVQGQFAIDHYGHEIIPPSNWINEPVNITVRGRSNYTECSAEVEMLFNHTFNCTRTPCTFNGVFQPTINGTFKAFSAFKFIKTDLNPNNESMSFEDYKSKLEQLCSKDKSNRTDEFIKWRCFDLTYMLNVLSKLGFNDTNWKNIEFIDQINGKTIGWSIGYIINKTMNIPKLKHFLQLSVDLFAVLCAILVIILILACFFCILYSKLKRNLLHSLRSSDMNPEEEHLFEST